MEVVELSSVVVHPPPDLNDGPSHASVAYATMPNGSVIIVTGGSDGKVLLRDARTPDVVLASHTEPSPIAAIAIDVESSSIAIASDTKTKLLDLTTLDVKGVVGSESLPPRALAFSAKGSKLASGGDFSNITMTTVSSSPPLLPHQL